MKPWRSVQFFSIPVASIVHSLVRITLFLNLSPLGYSIVSHQDVKPIVTLHISSMVKAPALSRATSRSSLWRSWSPMLDPLSNYDKSRHQYPWLIGPDDDPLGSTPLQRATPLPSLIETPENRRDQNSSDSNRDLESSDPDPLLGVTERDPNLVGPYSIHSPLIKTDTLVLQGDLGRRRRSYESTQLESQQEVGIHDTRLLLHLYLSRLVHHARTSLTRPSG